MGHIYYLEMTALHIGDVERVYLLDRPHLAALNSSWAKRADVYAICLQTLASDFFMWYIVSFANKLLLQETGQLLHLSVWGSRSFLYHNLFVIRSRLSSSLAQEHSFCKGWWELQSIGDGFLITCMNEIGLIASTDGKVRHINVDNLDIPWTILIP